MSQSTEADLQAARYKEDPKGVLQWFMEHPEQAKAWETQFIKEQHSRIRKRSRILTIIGIIVWGAVCVILFPYIFQRLHP